MELELEEELDELEDEEVELEEDEPELLALELLEELELGCPLLLSPPQAVSPRASNNVPPQRSLRFFDV